MANLYKQYKTDPAKEKEGQWFRVYLDDPDRPDAFVRFLMGRAGGENTRFMKERDRLARKMDLQDGKKVKTEDLVELQLRAVARGCCFAWEYYEDENAEPEPWIEDADGEPMDCTPDNAERLFLDLRELGSTLAEKALEYQNYLASKERAEEKNSPTSSNSN